MKYLQKVLLELYYNKIIFLSTYTFNILYPTLGIYVYPNMFFYNYIILMFWPRYTIFLNS